MRLLLIRHGEIPSNVTGTLDTAQPGPSLTPEGQRQARSLVERLAGIPIDAVYASTLPRSQETARPLAEARGLPVVVLEGIHEIPAGVLEGRNDDGAVSAYRHAIISWSDPTGAETLEGGESCEAFFTRWDQAIARVAADLEDTGGETAAVVSHGAAIAVWAANRARHVDPRFLLANHLVNTGAVILVGGPATGWDLVEMRGLDV